MSKTNTVFQLTFPDDGWKETTVHTFQGPNSSGVQHSLVLTIEPSVKKTIELVEFVHGQLVNIKQAMPGFVLVHEGARTILNGKPGYEVVYKYSPTEGIVYFQKQIYVRFDEKVFIFSSAFSKKTLSTMGPLIDSIITSLKVLTE
jgi:hypothetical protein